VWRASTTAIILPNANANASTPVSAEAWTTPASSHSSASPVNTYTLHELSLLHRYTTVTSPSLVNDHPDLLPPWQSAFPEIGFRFPFVLHGLFSLASLHQAHLSSFNRRRLLAEAAANHNLLIQGFQEESTNITDDNCDALLAFGCINVVYVFGMYGWLHDDSESEAVRKSRILGAEWVPTIRGVGAVMDLIHLKVRNGPLRPLADIEPWLSIDPEKDEVPEDGHLLDLRRTWQDSSSGKVYDETLAILRKCYAFTAKYSPSSPSKPSTSSYYHSSLSGPIIWIFMAPQEYFHLLSQRQPAALLLFAYLGALFTHLDDYWYFKGWGRDIVEAVEELLGEYWAPYLSWPKECTRG